MISMLEYQILEPFTLYIRWICSQIEASQFKLYRGVNPEELKPLAVTYDNYYSDISLGRERALSDIYFKIEAYDSNGGLLDEHVEHFNSTKINNYLRYRKWFQTNFLKAVRNSAAGHQIVVLQRRQSGDNCPECSHPQTGEPTNPRCQTCWGTGFDKGFYTPMTMSVLFGNFMTQENSYGTENHTNKEFDSIVAYAYPQLYDGDIVINKTTGVRYRVSGRGKVYNRYDFNRLGAVTYTIELLDDHHPMYAYSVVENTTNVTGVTVTRVAEELTVTGQLLRPRYGSVSVMIQDMTPTIKNFQTSATLNDALVFGTYTGSAEKNIIIEIDSVGVEDTFRWSLNGGTTWEESLEPLPLIGQALGDTGVSVTFLHETGHTVGDSWTFTLGAAGILNFQAFLYAQDLIKLTDAEMVFSIPESVATLANAEYRVVTNNDYYKGTVLWT